MAEEDIEEIKTKIEAAKKAVKYWLPQPQV